MHSMSLNPGLFSQANLINNQKSLQVYDHILVTFGESAHGIGNRGCEDVKKMKDIY